MLNYQNEKWDEPRLTHRDFQALFEATNQAMFVENSDGYIVAINAAGCKLWGDSLNNLIGKHAAEILPPKLGTTPAGKIRRSHYTRPDGEVLQVEVLSTPITLGDNEAFLSTISQIHENASSQTSSQPDAMPSLQRFSERVSHDFNNILTSVVGFGSLMQSDETLSDTSREYLKQVLEAAQKAEQLTSELLSFGRTTEKPSTECQVVSTVQKADAPIRQILGDKISLTTLCEENIAPIAGSDETLTAVLLELATNSREALEGAAEGTVKIELSSDDEGSSILRFSDDGPGIDEQLSSSAFEPFITTKQDRKLRGLGLTRVFSAVKNLGGNIDLQSSPTTGTSLTLKFPALPVTAELPSPISTMTQPQPEPTPVAKPAPKPASKRPALPGGTETILVVEDEPMVREIVVRSLTHLGYTVHKACDGQEGLERSRELAGEIDLIFSDIVMPRLSGPEMIEKVREENRTTPVLFTTGFTESKHIMENGGDLREGLDLLQKPYTPNVLAERVREKLDSLIS